MMFREDKATAMAVFFLKQAPDQRLDDLVLMKLMVIAERKNMAMHTSLITGARFASMQNGPVLSEVLDLFREQKPTGLWGRCIGYVTHKGRGTPSNHLVLKNDLDLSQHLSEHELKLLESVWHEFGHKRKWTLVGITHEFPEWDRTCQATKSSRPINLEDVFHLGLGDPADRARERAQEIEYFEEVAA